MRNAKALMGRPKSEAAVEHHTHFRSNTDNKDIATEHSLFTKSFAGFSVVVIATVDVMLI